MAATFLQKHSLLLLCIVMGTVFAIVGVIAIYGVTTMPPNVTLDIQSTGSTDSPQSTRYLLVVGIEPAGTRVKWSEVKVLVRPDCAPSEGNVDSCPPYTSVTQGKDYIVKDNDHNGRVTKDDVLQFNITASSSWGSYLALKYSKSGNIMYEEFIQLT